MKPEIRFDRRSYALRWGLSVVAVIAIGAGLFYGYDHGISPQVAVQDHSNLGRIMAAGDDAVAIDAPAESASPAVAAIPLAPPSKARTFDALKNGTPAQKFGAYKLVHDCLEAPFIVAVGARANPPIILPPPDPEVCGDLQPGQIAAEVRIPLLIEASRAGVKGSYYALAVNEAAGVFGDNGAAVVTEALRKEARAAALEHADPNVLFAESEKLLTSDKFEDRTKALVQNTAYLIGKWEGTANENNPIANPLLNPLNQRLMAGMTPQEAEARIAEGRVLAKKLIK